MRYLGLVVYFWGSQEQNRLLTECLRPMAGEMTEIDLCVRIWFCRFDARGPHLFATFSHSAGTGDALRRLAESRVRRYLRDNPSPVVLSQRELAERHEACRGKTISQPDAAPGFGLNNTFQLFNHPMDGYPFGLCTDVAQREPWAQALSGLADWAAQKIAERSPPVSEAVRWTASLHQRLLERGADAESYWRYHLGTLLPTLPERLAQDCDAVAASLANRLSERNRELFGVLFQAGAAVGPDWPGLASWLNVALDCGRLGSRPWAPLRESLHGLFNQIGLPVRQQIPIVLYAWLESLRLRPEAPEPLHRSVHHS